MTAVQEFLAGSNDGLDIGDYCRRVEEHLSRVNEGHLVRIVGTGFELVRQWAIDGVPFSVVCRGIDLKAERHRAGRSTRPLRIEFCESDVVALFHDWKRAVGVMGPPAAPHDPSGEEVKRPAVSKHLDRVIAGLMRAAGRLDTPADLRDGLTRILQDIVELRESTRGRRSGHATDSTARLSAYDAELMALARGSLAPAEVELLRAEAAAELEVYRARMPGEAWARSVGVATDRLLRERLNLPTIEI